MTATRSSWAARSSLRISPPAHTKGCTTWTMQITDAGKTYQVVIIGSPNPSTTASSW